MTAIAERYARAMGSSHLEVGRWFEAKDIDVLIAVGTLRKSLGTDLLRVRVEYDSISSMPGASGMRMKLKSAGTVLRQLHEIILHRAGRPTSAGLAIGQGFLDGFGHEMAGKLLDQWIDPTCPNCTGRGLVGAYGERQLICPVCSGSKRRTMLWSVEEQRLADEVWAEMEAKVDTAERRIRKLLRQD